MKSQEGEFTFRPRKCECGSLAFCILHGRRKEFACWWNKGRLREEVSVESGDGECGMSLLGGEGRARDVVRARLMAARRMAGI